MKKSFAIVFIILAVAVPHAGFASMLDVRPR